ncbi:hypothetical protein ACHAPT_009483 [Fusarium lateritium]
MAVLKYFLLGMCSRFCTAFPPQAIWTHLTKPDHQVTMGSGGDHSYPSTRPQFKAGTFTLKSQPGDLCRTYGEKQWTGTVDVSDDKRLFYWFFESRNDPANDPVIIWMNGGPGGSSMMGMLTEMGPCTLDPNSRETSPNPYSWNNNASVLFLDQPAGTGLAQVAQGRQYPDTDQEGAVDFQTFLNIFFRDIFADYNDHTIHIAGESYGGHWVPTYVRHIIESRYHNSHDAFRGHIESVILVNAVIEMAACEIGVYELMCTDFRGLQFNQSTCNEIASAMPECVKLVEWCRLSEDPEICQTAFGYCATHVGRFYNEEMEAGLRSPYNNYSPDFHYQLVNLELNGAFQLKRSPFLPMSPHLSYLLDSRTEQRKARGLRMLVLNGNEDYIVNTPGQKWVFENLRWTGQQAFRAAKWIDWPAKAEGSGTAKEFPGSGFWKQTPDAQLVVVGVNGAGHEAPRLQGEATADIVNTWLKGWAL